MKGGYEKVNRKRDRIYFFLPLPFDFEAEGCGAGEEPVEPTLVAREVAREVVFDVVVLTLSTCLFCFLLSKMLAWSPLKKTVRQVRPKHN